MQEFKTPKDLLSEDDLKKYKEYMYPFNLKVLYDALLDKLKEDPDYEIWVPLNYFQWESSLKKRSRSEHITPPSIIISSQGKVYDRRREVFINTRTYGDEWYSVFSLWYGRRVITFPLHRAIGCSFIPVGKEYGILGYSDLVMNHLDGKKNNNKIPNLEWTTQLGNNLHALQNKLRVGCSGWKNNRSKPVKGTILEGAYRGHEFIICGAKEAKQYGFFMAGISLSCLDGCDSYKNCSWSWATDEEIKLLPTGIDEDKRNTINFFKGTVKSKIKATCLTTGKTFIITKGMPEIIELGFRPSEVTSVIKGKRKSHKGHTFIRI